MKLVMVEWLDSHSGRGWQPLHDIQDASVPLRCRSVGWLASERNGCKVLVPHVSGEGNEGIVRQGCGDLTIPNKSIVKLTVLRKN